jgi:hypothetical protein
MGIDDRDYMRERYRDRQGKAAAKTIWNDRKASVEHPHDKQGKAVPLGSATYETVVRPMVFTRRTSRMIDLHRSPAGNLHTNINFTNPKPLN